MAPLRPRSRRWAACALAIVALLAAAAAAAAQEPADTDTTDPETLAAFDADVVSISSSSAFLDNGDSDPLLGPEDGQPEPGEPGDEWRAGRPRRVTKSQARRAAKAPAAAELALAQAGEGAVTPMAMASTYSVLLSRHNGWRRAHSAGALNWANKCKFQHSSGNYGENLYATSSTQVARAVDGSFYAWYNEIKDYDFSKPDFGYNTGHFTQVVWKGSTKIGCGYKLCPTLAGWAPGRIIVVCQYSPPGNVIGAFAANVKPLCASPVDGKAIISPDAALVSGGACLEADATKQKCLRSAGKRFFFCINPTGGLAAFDCRDQFWNRTTLAPKTKPFKLCLQDDANLVARDGAGKAYWSSNTKGKGTAPLKAFVGNDGDFKVLDKGSVRVWGTGARGGNLV
ncbi:hypothetical protein Rsub_06935 [Raphidocelis subcapitata]|uniref:Bulb-type lectin domain-containing protein n=1 Tax=Raphidocelis subcapitata TaxID=307507 RepID=A0A2V0P8U6_9CHLO|nr:hypothetical protein Rsub_06935 [Raphidocelis subcapitata]|eukprot:GBF94313.1 hypothetical protein Rsub_06935 [Raphidocelis subcapitata]